MKSLTLKNFQAHKLLEIQFGKTVTSIIGPSDAGKSAIIRALRWVLLNKPQGNAFIRDGSKMAEVYLQLDDDTLLTRMKGGSENSYHVNEQEFVAFGNEVPAEVSKVTKVGDINFQGQHDSPFWFSETAGEVSRQLNQIVDLDIIDTVLTALASKCRSAKAEVEVVEGQLATAQEQREAMKWIHVAAGEFKGLEELETVSRLTAGKHSSLRSVLEKVATHQTTLTGAKQAFFEGNKVVEKGCNWTELHVRVTKLRDLLSQITRTRVTAHRIIPNLSDLEEKNKKATWTKESATALKKAIDNLKYKREESCQKRKSYKKEETLFHERMKGTCPLCNQKIP